MYKKLTKIFFLNLVGFLFLFNFSFAEKVEDLQIDKYVNDFADFLSIEKERELNNLLGEHFASTSNQVVLVSVNDMGGDYIEHYSIKLAEKIKAGDAKKDNGVLFLISKNDRKFRIEVGYGLEPVLTDGISNYILQNILKKEFQNNNYEIGIENSLREIVNVLEKNVEGNLASINSSANFPQSKNSFFAVFLGLLPFILFFGILLFEWLAAVLGRTKSWWLGGVAGSGLGLLSFLFFTTLISLEISLILGILGFIFDYFVSKNYDYHKKNPTKRGPPDWWSGGTWGPGSTPWTSSGSDYTFSGGGGGFGGGGASGDW